MSDASKHKTALRVQIGTVAVDSGCVLISDPCYALGDAIPADLQEWLIREGQLFFDKGYAGAGVLVHTLYGDGNYPVYANLDESGRAVSVTIEFDGEV